MRQKRNLNKDWQFIRKDIGLEAAVGACQDIPWEPVTLPHTWNAVDGANGFSYHKGACWYKRTLQVSVDDLGRRLFLEFEGANSVADVYVNGEWLGQHRGGFSTFRFDATEAFRAGGNELLVKVDNTVVADVYPQMADFTFYGGLYRDVNLLAVDPVHFDLLDEGAPGVYLIQDKVTSAQAELTVKALIRQDGPDPVPVRVWVDLLDSAGTVKAYAAREAMVTPGETQCVAFPLTVSEPILWHGRENPYLHTARVSLQLFNDTVDQLDLPVGLRSFQVDPSRGFILNGSLLPLNGVSRHQDRKDMGWAITAAEQREDMALIREVGATSIRLAHYQHNQVFYDLCDSEGMVVWAEIPFISVMSKTELEGINPKQQMRELIKQNHHHPAICFWGVQNEIQIGGDRPEVRRLVQELVELTKQTDPTRLTTMANVMFVPDTDSYNRMTDVIGYNKYYGWYQGKAEDFGPWIDGFHAANPDIPLCISEYGAEGIIRYHSETPDVKDYTEEYHALYHETVWNQFRKRPYLWATYVWNMFDFGANIRDEGGVKGRNNKGLVTYDRRVKKDAFYLYKAHWSSERFVHIASKRFVERAQEQIDVKVYTTCSDVALSVNGEMVAELHGVDAVAVFSRVVLQPGANTLSVEATAEHGAVVCRDVAHFLRVESPNPAYRAPEAKGSVVANWFSLPPDLEAVEVQPLVVPDGMMSTATSLGELMRHPETRKVIHKYLGHIEDRPMYGMMEGFTLNGLAEMDKELFNEKMMYVMNRELLAAQN